MVHFFNQSGAWPESQCPACTRLPGACGYGNAVVNVVADGVVQRRCETCDTWGLAALNRVMAPTQPASCPDFTLEADIVRMSVCAKGHYARPSSLACQPCKSIELQCERGHYPPPCIEEGPPVCLPCTWPPLRNDANETTMYRYGVGFAYKDCGALAEHLRFSDAVTPTCAWYQTPKWGGGYCEVECAEGFAPGVGGVCRACETRCPPGYYPPHCPGGANPGHECLACDGGLLPEGARWREGCAWACAENHYSPLGGCVACPPASACPAGERYLGCNGLSAGECRPCTLRCTAPRTFLSAAVHMDECACRACREAVPGVSYVVRGCTNVSDTTIAPCSACVDGVTFESAACGVGRDTVCAPCTPPQAGRLLRVPCGARADAVYGACPEGRVCDGSAVHAACAPPRRARDGLCVCPPATGGEACEPIACPDAMYPDPSTGNCTACGGGAAVRSVPGVLGIDACGCERGYFRRRQRDASGAVVGLSCWPCGDLGCATSVRRQLPACDDPFGEEEPRCVCAMGPWAGGGCGEAPRCADGFRQVLPHAEEGRFDRFGFLRNLAAPPAPISMPRGHCGASGIIGSAAVGAAALAVACGDGTAYSARADTGESAALNLSALLEIPGWRSGVRLTALKGQAPAPGLVWVAFRFFGVCGAELDNMQPTAECSAIELVSLTACSSEAIICALSGSLIWGKRFGFTGVLGRIEALTWMQDPLVAQSNAGRLYFGLSGRVYYYDVVFYAADTPIDQRADDPYVLLDEAPGLRDLVWANRRLYAVINGGVVEWRSKGEAFLADGARALLPVPGAPTLVCVLYADGRWRQLDLVNRLLSAPALNGETLAWRAGGALVVHGRNRIQTIPSVLACPLDQIAVLNECSALPCIRAEPCGPHSARRPGDARCHCVPGFYLDAGGCAVCTDDHHCPGDSAPIRCPDHSRSRGGAACACEPGYYGFGGACLACPTNHFCPFGGVPVPCHGGGETNGGGAASPLDCICPPRTHGIRCEPCDDNQDCSLPLSRQPVLMASVLTARAPDSDKELILRQCVVEQHADNIIYAAGDGGWVLLSSVNPWDKTNATGCLAAHGFADIATGYLGAPRAAIGVKQAVRCAGVAQEWWEGKGCGCIAGYEALATARWGTQCFPCLNGTARARYAMSGCAPCPDGEIAPWMGMSACICAGGWDAASATCVGQPEAGLALPSPTLLIVASTVLGVGLLVVSLVAGRVLR